MKKVLLKIDGMTCSACSSGLEKYLNKQDGISSASVNLVMNNANIEYDDSKLTLEQIEKFVKKAGFESLGIDNLEKEARKKSNEKYKIVFLSIISIAILYISMGCMIGLPAIPFLDMNTHPNNYAITLLILAFVALFLGRDILKNGCKNLIHRTPNMDTLVTIGVLSSYIYSLYNTYKIFAGEKQYVDNLYFESAAIVIFFIKIGKYVENKNKDKTKEALQNLMSITPNYATIEFDQKEKMVTIDEINVDDIVVCKPGEKIAVDGEIISGETHINESFITGESVPVKRIQENKVIAGSINCEGTIKYKAEKIGKNSTVSEIVRLVANATSTKAPIAKIADKISGYFVPAVITLSILAFFVWLVISKDIAFSLNIFVSVLVVACPCSLGLATPLAIVVASGNASKKGILIKSSEALENAHKVKTICFDKTGTLTKGRLSVSKIYNYSELSENELLKKVASVENKSEHPIAKAIIEEAQSRNIELEEVTDFRAVAGFGVIAQNLKGEKIYIGNSKLMKENNIKIENIEDEKKLTSDGNSVLFIAESNKVIGLIGVKDILRNDVLNIVKNIKQKGIEVIMLTGDNYDSASNIAKQVGIDQIIANVTPKEKAEKINEFKSKGLVLMCGDGINDSVSLVTADIGVSIATGTDIAMNSASVVLMSDNLERLNDLLEISRKTTNNIKQNLFWAFFYNICMIPIACGAFMKFGLTINPMIGSLAMTLSSLTVVINALRLKNM